jgi:hypothetical protein
MCVYKVQHILVKFTVAVGISIAPIHRSLSVEFEGDTVTTVRCVRISGKVGIPAVVDVVTLCLSVW